MRKGSGVRLREYVGAVGLLGMMGCAHYVHPTPTRSAYVMQGKNAGAANIVISDTDLAKTSSAHFGLLGFLFPVTVRWGKVVPEYLQECTRKVFREVAVNGSGKFDAVFDVRITAAELSALTGKANVALFVDGKLADGRSLVNGEYTGAGMGHFPIYQEPATVEQWLQVERTTDQALMIVCNKLVNDVQSRIDQ